MQWGPLWYPWAMKPPIFIRSLTEEERMQLEADRRIAEACRVRRAQIILASARRLSPKPIAQLVGCSVQTVRNVIHAFNTEGVEGLRKQSNRPKTVEPTLDAAHCERLQHILHQSPRTYGTPTGVWTLALAAEVCYAQGVTERLMSDETIRRARKRLETNWKRAKHWITSPDPQYARKKSGAIA
jgi:transposase